MTYRYYYTRHLGNKHYELKDHLGNVRTVVSDRKLAEFDGGALENTAEVVSYNNYYSFGMMMPGFKYNAPQYRYGFNGKEMDNDFSGGATGVIYDHGFRIYDPRIAKFLSVDPLTASYPWYTPYQFAGNNPIWAIDLDGLEEEIIINYNITMNAKTKYKYTRIINYRTMDGLAQGPLGDGLLQINVNLDLRTGRESTVSYIYTKDDDYGFSYWEDYFTFYGDHEIGFIDPPIDFCDDPILYMETTVKAGLAADVKISIGGIKFNAGIGNTRDFIKTKWSERGLENSELVGESESFVSIAGLKYRYGNTGGEYTQEILNYKGTKKKNAYGQWITTESWNDDIELIDFGITIIAGGEAKIVLTNPARRAETQEWEKYLLNKKELAKQNGVYWERDELGNIKINNNVSDSD